VVRGIVVPRPAAELGLAVVGEGLFDLVSVFITNGP
jgi:hypothetical protein